MKAVEIKQAISDRKVKAEEVVCSCFDRISEVESKIKSFLYIAKEKAIEQAKEIDKKIASGRSIGKLAGIPVSIKDNICTEGMPTTCASRILTNFISPYNATVVDKILAEDGILLGKNNCDEFAMGSSTENSFFFPTTNPWDITRVPGGSSGGSASAVASGEVPLSLGTDTGGSIRQPASLCGIVGLKPTYGRVSRFGLVAFASSLDQIGPMGRCVEDIALLLEVIAGKDWRDSTSAPIKVDEYSKELSAIDPDSIKVALIKELLQEEGIEEGVKDVIYNSVKILSDLGFKIEEVSLPHLAYSLPVYYLISSAEASSNLARYDGVRYGERKEVKDGNVFDMYINTRTIGLGPEVKRRIMLGTFALSAGYYDAYYLKAQKVRTLIKQEFRKAFDKYQILLGAVSPTVAFKLGEKLDNPVQMYLSDICTLPASLAGIPALSLPVGLYNCLPVGLQIIGDYFCESLLLKVAYILEKEIGVFTPVFNEGK